MPAKIDIPLAFRAAESALKIELERFAGGIYRYTQDAALFFEPKPTVSKIYETGTISAAFDAITRVAPRADETVTVQLPRPDSKQGGRRLFVQRMNTLGAIVLSPLGCTVNTYDRIVLSALPGYITARFDGENYFTDLPGCADWGEAL